MSRHWKCSRASAPADVHPICAGPRTSIAGSCQIFTSHVLHVEFRLYSLSVCPSTSSMRCGSRPTTRASSYAVASVRTSARQLVTHGVVLVARLMARPCDGWAVVVMGPLFM